MVSRPLKVRALNAVPVSVPMKRPLGTSAQTIRNAPLLLVTLETEEGVAGHSYAFCYLEPVARSLAPIVAALSQHLAGQDASPLELSRSIARYFKLTGLYGPLCMIASAIDAAAWDVLSRSVGLPLATVLGGNCEPVPAYNSNGLGLMPAEKAADEAEELIADGFRGVKLRLGRSTFSEDLAVVRAVRKRIPDTVALMVDFNQALTFAKAMEFCPALDDEGVYWIEEPIKHDDFAHAARIADATRTPLQLGENFVGTGPVLDALRIEATDFLMFDLDRIGGVTGWKLASGLALAAGREVSTHLFPEISAHLLAATPTKHWLEYVDWAEPLLEEPLEIRDGMAIISSRPGNGISWNAAAVQAYTLN
ncbi:L-alanine-DL-glutamate epimerase and related enzymes of enolase superfamily [Paraburkholderia caribensis MBA4]|uniref:L-alanine-DL-glutamate epimerase and related enzymes of enolase superfamily n=1 Tax=Paraburkholderia caribensis MBA4 TaxID=1323664 RepID=A0A0P0RI11_9BURK|nr:enolase C-terminal domain-like protein [Paraburkholderia caribensis]ALL68346.1 L-alanine-DL-glutamate epimerase and related enzymes of enolase superfamily [Paraburkholderia caribensis MBA4]